MAGKNYEHFKTGSRAKIFASGYQATQYYAEG